MSVDIHMYFAFPASGGIYSIGMCNTPVAGDTDGPYILWTNGHTGYSILCIQLPRLGQLC